MKGRLSTINNTRITNNIGWYKMPTATEKTSAKIIDIEELRQIIHDEVRRAVQEVLAEMDFMSDEEIHDYEEAMKDYKEGKAIDWNDFKKQRGMK